MTTHHSTDIIIIGAGPVGLFTIFQAGMLKLRCHVIDTLEFAGGQCKALYPEKPIYDIPGHPHILAQDLIERLEQQATPFKPVYHLGQRAMTLTEHNGLWTVTTTAGTSVTAKAVIIASGCGAFGPNRPPLDDIAKYEGTSIFYMISKREFFRDKRVMIAGGGDSAADWAISLSEIAKRVTVVHRRNKFRCTPDSHEKLLRYAAEGKLDLAIPFQLHTLLGKGKQLTSVEICTMEGESRYVETDILLPFFGLALDIGSMEQWGLMLDNKRFVVDPTTMQTSKKNVFAVGDMAYYPNKLKLILTGFSEAAMACHTAHANLFPDQAIHFEYSTTSGIPEL